MKIQQLALGLLNLFTAVVEGFLGIRFVLKLFGANAANGFVSWIYGMSNTLLQPFRGIFPTEVLQHKYVLEFSTVFAMLMYAIAAMLLLWVITWATPAPAVTVKKR